MKKTMGLIMISPVILTGLGFMTIHPTTGREPGGTPMAKGRQTGWETLIDSTSFSSYAAFEANWSYLYPWGDDHNGSAKMVASHGNHQYVTLLPGSVLRLRAVHLSGNQGRSSHAPHLPIRYYSGAVYAKQKVTVSDKYPVYEVGGYFKAPTAKGTWPAFWLTAVKGWPPETDILEYKGDNINWQNTFVVPNKAETIKTRILDASSTWHQYKAVLQRVNDTDIDLHYFVDGRQTGTHRCNFMNKPMWLIINLQMEGSSIGPGPASETDYYIKDVFIRRKSR